MSERFQCSSLTYAATRINRNVSFKYLTYLCNGFVSCFQLQLFASERLYFKVFNVLIKLTNILEGCSVCRRKQVNKYYFNKIVNMSTNLVKKLIMKLFFQISSNIPSLQLCVTNILKTLIESLLCNSFWKLNSRDRLSSCSGLVYPTHSLCSLSVTVMILRCSTSRPVVVEGGLSRCHALFNAWRTFQVSGNRHHSGKALPQN